MLVYKVRLINMYKVWIIISIFHHYENNNIVLHHHVFSNCKEIRTFTLNSVDFSTAQLLI